MKAMQRVVMMGSISHALAFSAMFVILSGLITNGSLFVSAFLGTALLMLVFGIFTLREPGGAGRQRFFYWGLGSIALGIGGLAWIDAEQMLASSLLFIALGLLMWRRMLYMSDNVTYLRQALLDHYRLDVQLLIAFAAITWLAGRDPGWETSMLPFFISFLLTRMLALSMAAKLNNPNKNKATGAMLANNMPAFFVGGVLLLMWMISVVGGPLDRLLATIISPLFYAMGFLVQWISEMYGETIRKAMAMVYGNAGKRLESLSPDSKDISNLPTSYLSDGYVYGLVGLGVLLLIWYFYRQMKNMSRLQLDAGIVEVREFIHDETVESKPRARTTFSGHLTPMRQTYRRFLLAMKKSGHLRSEGETASEYIKKISAEHPELGSSMEELTDYYMRERYGAKRVDDQQSRAEQLTDELARGRENKKKE